MGLPVGSRLSLGTRLPDSPRPIDLAGRERNVMEHHKDTGEICGVGVEFEDLQRAARKAVETLLLSMSGLP